MTRPTLLAITAVSTLLLFLCLGSTPSPVGSAVRIWPEPLVMPTYRVDPPDRHPRFYEGRAYQGAQGRVYPYPIFESLTSERFDKAYDMV